MIRKCDLNKCKKPPCEQRQEIQLAPGNNSLRVRAYTAAGLGPFSQPVFWIVEVRVMGEWDGVEVCGIGVCDIGG